MSTEQGHQLVFGPFRFDPTTNQLWQGEQAVALQPKPLAVLRYLAERPGQIVTKQELLKAVWTGVYVAKAVVKECVRTIREALGEDATAPRYLETVGREGYRLIAPLAATPFVSGFKFQVSSSQSTPAPSPQHPAPLLVGREAELQRMHTLLGNTLAGQRQIVFITGEPGIGKTTVVDRFLHNVRTAGRVRIGRGQCIEQHGQGEAYLPVLEALGQLCHEPGGEQVPALLRHYAPTWLMQLPAVVAENERKVLAEQVQGATHERMLREIADALEALSSNRCVLLILEDVHWSDPSTVELLSVLAQRRQPARLLIIGTYRPAELVLGKHPLKAVKQELQAHGQCEELRLELLTGADVTAYMGMRFTEAPFTAGLSRLIHRRTDGNALFMVNVVEELLRQGIIAEQDGQWELKGELAHVSVPDTLRQLIEKQITGLSEEEQDVLEAASVAGTEFPVAAVAAALQQDSDGIEEICEGVAWQGHFLEEKGLAEWPDGTVSGRYAFRHTLYQNVLYERMAEARRVRLHRLIGERLEARYGQQAKEIAAELAVHFKRGRDYQRAIQYLQQAGENAIRRSAYVEAIAHLTRGLELLKTLADAHEHAQQELILQLSLAILQTFFERKGLTKKATNWLNVSVQLHLQQLMAYDNCQRHSAADACG